MEICETDDMVTRPFSGSYTGGRRTVQWAVVVVQYFGWNSVVSEHSHM